MSPFDPAWAPREFNDWPDQGDAMRAASLLAIDPRGLGGILLRAWSGPAREDFLGTLHRLFPASTKLKKIPLNITVDRLLGGLDLAATMASGKPVIINGILGQPGDAILLLSMAERISSGTAAQLAAAWDEGAPFCMLALDEGDADEAAPAVLADRLAFTVSDFGDGLAPSPQDIVDARRRLPSVTASVEAVHQICTAAALLGVASARAGIFACRAACAATALRGGAQIEEADIATAIRLVLLPRAMQIPQTLPPFEQPAESGTTPENQPQAEQMIETLQDRLEGAGQAVLPEKLLAMLAQNAGPRRAARGSGKSGASASHKRGRPISARRGTLGGDARLSLLDTLRAAAPWQLLRRPVSPGPLRMVVRAEDIRIKRFKEKSRNVTIFAVDASGSSALNRLAEAKGAILLLLADCYVRRDEVALVAFRGTGAEVLLPPTHALARACRSLAGLPGGGPTPLAAGITTARLLAETERRKGHQPLLLLLTDGGANIALDGAQGRQAAGSDALAAAKRCQGIPSMVLDISPRKQDFVRQIANAMTARYVPLPYADSASLGRIVAVNGGIHAARIA